MALEFRHDELRGATFTNRHYVAVVQHGARLQVRSTPGSRSRLMMDLTANGQVLTGTWTEETNPAVTDETLKEHSRPVDSD